MISVKLLLTEVTPVESRWKSVPSYLFLCMIRKGESKTRETCSGWDHGGSWRGLGTTSTFLAFFWLFWLSLLPHISSLCSVNGTLLSIKANAENRVAILSLPLCEHVLHTMLLVLMWPWQMSQGMEIPVLLLALGKCSGAQQTLLSGNISCCTT